MGALKDKSERLLARINRNVDDLYADRIDMAIFDARQRAAWDAVVAAGPEVRAEVLRAIRQQLPSPTQRF